MRKLALIVPTLLAATLALGGSSAVTLNAQQTPPPSRTPDVIFVPTPQTVVDAMLKLANVTKNDVVYDLGCGNGIIPVTAAKTYGARGVCIDIDLVRIGEANKNVADNNVGDKVRVIHADLFADTTKLGEATVVTLYLLPSLNVKLMPKLKAELKPGTRIVSHSFDMQGQWMPEKTLEVDGRSIYYWTIPAR